MNYDGIKYSIWILSIGLMLPLAGFRQNKESVSGKGVDQEFATRLSAAGIFEAARQIGMDKNLFLIPLLKSTNHPYRSYRWSVGYHKQGGIMINALPPEEEMGWTPWEYWYKDAAGIVRKKTIVLYPLKNPTEAGVARWYDLEEEAGLLPRFLNEPEDLDQKLHLARIDEVAKILGIDASKVLVKPLSEEAKTRYMQCRWVVIPHYLANDAPVIYILPPMHRSDEWPWESWYSDGKVPLIHHVHYTKTNALTGTSNVWKEYPGSPQRPPEIFGVTWYWYNDLKLKPAWIDPGQSQ